VIVERTEHPGWLSNAFLVADGAGGHGVLVDGNGVVEPLLERIERDGIRITHVLLTHEHGDHVVDAAGFKARFHVPVVAHEATARALGGIVDEVVADGGVIRSGDLEIEAIATPGHSAGHLAFLVNGTDCLTADCLFRGTVGGCRARGAVFAEHRGSIMDRLMRLPPETRIHPGHRESSTIGAEWESNPFIRVWRGLDPEQAEPCRALGEEATLVLWAPDYDGGHKAWVRFSSGEDQIVGGSRVERL
jgi:glyoxylase-like metal-dependent hydrolase (beta-lactamase superfamily II)